MTRTRPARSTAGRSKRSSTRSSSSSAVPRRSRRAASCCARFSARFARRCSPCRPRNTTGSTFRLRSQREARGLGRSRPGAAGEGRRRAARRPRTRRQVLAQQTVLRVRRTAFQRDGLAGLEHPAGRDPGSSGRCRATVPGVASRRSSSSMASRSRAGGALDRAHDQVVTYLAPAEPGLTRLQVTVRQRDIVCVGRGDRDRDARIARTAARCQRRRDAQGLPGYTFERAPGESWRSKLDTETQPDRRQQRPPRLRLRVAQQT